MKKISNISVLLNTSDIKEHRYKSIDDWFDPLKYKDFLQFKAYVADIGNMDYNFLVLMHALVEQYLCYKHKIKDKQVTEFDISHTHCDNPGEHDEAPYHLEHQTANDIESMLSVALGVTWEDYEKAIDKTLKKFPKKI